LSAAPLKSIESDFAVDSSGFSTGQFVRWLDVKNSAKEDRRQWLKLHLMVGVKTNVVTSVQVSDGYAHDYPFYKGLVDKTANAGFQMKEVSADKGYLGASNMLATLQHGAIPYIPFKTNSVPDSRGSYGPKSELWSRCIIFTRSIVRSFYSIITSVQTSNHVPHDQDQVRSTLAESDSHGTD
jgi:Transposase DDE domain